VLMGLLLVGAIAVFGAFAARRRAAPQPYAGAAAGAGITRGSFDMARDTRIEPTLASAAGTSAPTGRYPAGFDPVPFIGQAKQQFRRLQSAYDRGDDAMLADVTTPEMHAEIVRDLAARGTHQPTEVAALDADIVEVVREGDRYVASVRFHGSLHEDGAREAQPFEEVWHLIKPVDGSSGWLLAGIQQYA
jgi:predicted lipid-binding transport protein (Tim44 family)